MKKPLILAVDDAPDLLALIARALSDEYEVRTATSGAQALLAAGAEPQPVRVAADHVRGFGDGARDRVVDAAAEAADLGTRHVDNFLLSVIHQRHAARHALADHGARGERAVDVVDLDPIVIDNADFFRLRF